MIKRPWGRKDLNLFSNFKEKKVCRCGMNQILIPWKTFLAENSNTVATVNGSPIQLVCDYCALFLVICALFFKTPLHDQNPGYGAHLKPLDYNNIIFFLQNSRYMIDWSVEISISIRVYRLYSVRVLWPETRDQQACSSIKEIVLFKRLNCLN